MKICPITYEQIREGEHYSQKGLKLLAPRLTDLKNFPYSAEEQRRQVEWHSSKLSIQGVQPKLSVRLNIKKQTFEIVDHGGRFILKPQTDRFKNLPENEDVTMRMARAVGINTPHHGLVYSKDKTLSYFIRRFDRIGQRGKLHVEDFAQLAGKSRDTKYGSSMEKVSEIIEQYCTFPVVQKLKLFKLTLFSFLVGNEDMHLKNFSIIVRGDVVELTPAYDLLNSTIALAAPKEELALPLNGKRNHIRQQDIIKYFGMERLKLTRPTIDDVLREFKEVAPLWLSLLENCFLPKEFKKQYRELLRDRLDRMNLA